MAISFNGTTDYYNMGNGAALDIPNNAPMALMCWVNVTSFPGSGADATFVSKGYDGTNTAYELSFGNIPPLLLNWESFNGAVLGTNWTPTFGTGSWHHIYGHYTGSGTHLWEIYVDGSIVASTSNVIGPISTARNFNIGAIDANGTEAQFTSLCMADVAIFNGPLTGTEISNLANGSIRPNTGMSKTLLGYWSCDTAISVLPDLSGNSNVGNVHGTPTTCGSSPPFTGGVIMMPASLRLT